MKLIYNLRYTNPAAKDFEKSVMFQLNRVVFHLQGYIPKDYLNDDLLNKLKIREYIYIYEYLVHY